MTNVLDTLNNEQRLAATEIYGPVMVFAGAGTGKTKTLIARIINMIQNEHINPRNILAITFTKKATAEMRERLTNFIGDQTAHLVHISTIHSLCNRILRKYIPLLGFQKDFEIIDDEEMLKVIGEIIKENRIDRKLYPPRAILKMIGDYKNGLRSLDAEEENIYDLYQKYLKENNMVDFDDLLIFTDKLLDDENVRSYYQDLYRFILVDEFQDTNEIQYQIIKKLASHERNLFVVGDDDQSIYSFRGACVDNMLNFTKRDYPDAKVYKLCQNYRSNDAILKGSNSLIKYNVMREPKELFTDKIGPTTSVMVHDTYYYEDEVRYVINEIIHLVNHEKYQYSDIAILYRNNAISRNFELELIENGIPYNVYGGFSYLKRKEIKDIISYLRFIVDTNKIVHFKRIIDRPSRGIGEKTLAKLFMMMCDDNISLLEAIDRLYEENPSSKNKSLKEFKDIIVELQADLEKKNLVEFFDELIDKTGYLKMLEQEDSEDTNRVANLMEFKSILYKIEEAFEDSDLTQKEKIEVSLDEIILDQSYGEEQVTNAVTLSTIHSVKGLEFRAVFVVGLEEGIFPSIRDDTDIEEERRVAYVAFTRAKDLLFISCSSRRLIYGRVVKNQKSRFLKEFLLSEDLQQMVEKNKEAKKIEGEIKVGSKINHTYFGYGMVIASDDRFVQILFEKDNTIRKITKDHPTISLVSE